jgi:hypothetical protein
MHSWANKCTVTASIKISRGITGHCALMVTAHYWALPINGYCVSARVGLKFFPQIFVHTYITGNRVQQHIWTKSNNTYEQSPTTHMNKVQHIWTMSNNTYEQCPTTHMNKIQHIWTKSNNTYEQSPTTHMNKVQQHIWTNSTNTFKHTSVA